MCQKEYTNDQRGCDCFVFGYDNTNTLVDITRVSLVALIDIYAQALAIMLPNVP